MDQYFELQVLITFVFKSSRRENHYHSDCCCPHDKKMPALELGFIWSQRTKTGGHGSTQMGSIDYKKKTNRQVTIEKECLSEKRKKKRRE